MSITKEKPNPLKIYNLNDIEEDLKTLKPINFKTLNFNPKSIKDVISNLLDNCAATYIGSRIQCEGGRSRGIADIYRLCRYYFPNTTLQEVIKAVEKRDNSFCCTTNQTVFNGSVRKGLYHTRVRCSNRKAYRIN